MERKMGSFVVFFDIGGTLADPVLSDDGESLQGLTVREHVMDVLGQLKQQKMRLGIISDNNGFEPEAINKLLKQAGLFDFFVPDLIIYGSKQTPQIFQDAATRAGHPNDKECLFVGEDAGERKRASKFMRTASTPEAALKMLAKTK